MQKKLNYTIGALKRKLKMGSDDFEAGALISKMNESKKIISDKKQFSKTRLSIMGLV